MPRPPRLEFENCLYHVTSRGDRKEPIFDDDIDRDLFLTIVGKGLQRLDARAFAYCLMENHYHLVIQTRRANLSDLMRHINGVYTQAQNRRHGRCGHVFQGRFHAVVVDLDSYFLEVCRYVDLNPVRAGLVANPEAWRWSSYRAHIGKATGPAWLDSDALHRQCRPAASLVEAGDGYARFVAQGHAVRLQERHHERHAFLGDDAFARKMIEQADERQPGMLSQPDSPAQAKPLEWYFSRYERDLAVVQAFREGGHTMSAIANSIGRTVSCVSKLIRSKEYRASDGDADLMTPTK